MKGLGSVASLVEALHEEVEAQVANLRRQTGEEERRMADAAAAEPVEIAGRSERLAEEHRRAAEIAAREDWADRRDALEERERFVAEAARRGRSRLGEPMDPGALRALLVRLIEEALARLPGQDFEVLVRPCDRAVVEKELPSLAARMGKGTLPLSGEPFEGIGGAVVRTADGHTTLDNGFEARARRFESAWRAAVAEVYGP